MNVRYDSRFRLAALITEALALADELNLSMVGISLSNALDRLEQIMPDGAVGQRG